MTKRPSALPRPAWSKSALLDRAIQDLVRRWVGPSLLVVSAGACSAAVQERDADDDGSLEPFAPDLLAEGSGFDAMQCEAAQWDPMPHVTPATEHDYAALRSGYLEGLMQPPMIVSESGLMQELAADERRHATLSFELAAWLDARLSDDERAQVAAAYERAIAELRLQVRTQPSEALRRLAGIPDLVTASALFDALDTQLLH